MRRRLHQGPSFPTELQNLQEEMRVTSRVGRLGWRLLEKGAVWGDERNLLRQPGGPAVC